MNLWRKEEDDEKSIRSVLGRLLFSKHDSEKSVKVISGGEKIRIIFGKLSSGYY
ncbi:MAG: ATPase subunit of ABC transporter with duplicated ATPase domains [Halioglobus sp.]|jgi:ATPase subunit of ABC transporter with duplicated ATPase domains